MIILKLGGSVITGKSEYRSFRRETVARLAREIKRSGEEVIIVHGAGSFGHILSEKYSLDSGFTDESQIQAAARVMCDTRELSSMVVEEFLGAGVPAVSVPPGSCFVMDGGKLIVNDDESIRRLEKIGIMPVLFGDVVTDRSTGFGIVSGDQCVEVLCRMFDPKSVVFVSDVDGLYTGNPKTDTDAKLVEEFTKHTLDTVKTESDVADVTGGIRAKMEAMLRMTSDKRHCYLINGNVPDRLYLLLNGERVTGTVAKGGLE